MCVAVPQPASCQCLALNPAKAEPNYRCTATDLAGMLTITEEAAGRGSLGKVSAGRELHKRGPQGPGRRGGTGGCSILGSTALIIYHSRSLGTRKQPTIDCRHWWKQAEAERTPPTPPHPQPPSPGVRAGLYETVQNIQQSMRTMSLNLIGHASLPQHGSTQLPYTQCRPSYSKCMYDRAHSFASVCVYVCVCMTDSL